jgi:outer membrane receptor protein involved in Fe transport
LRKRTIVLTQNCYENVVWLSYRAFTLQLFLKLPVTMIRLNALQCAIAIALLPAVAFAQTGTPPPPPPPPPPETQEETAPVEEETMDEIRVDAKREAERVLDAEEERIGVGVSEVVSKAELTRLGDAELGQALKRVVGLSLVGSKFVYVRGLGERYSSVLLNGAQLPSPDPLRRVVPLDLFPNELLDGVSIAKSYTANLPGEFGGGAIELKTNQVNTKKSVLKIGSSIGYLSGTSFEDGLRYAGGNRDWLGFDRVRALPSESLIGASPATLESIGERTAAEGFDLSKRNIGPNFSQNIGFQGRTERFETPIWVRFGGRYAQAWESVEELRRGYGTSNAEPLFVARELIRDRTDRTIDLSAIAQVGLELNSDHRIEFSSLALRQSIDQAQEETGFTESPSEIVRFSELEWVENRMYSQQLAGFHYLPDFHEVSFDWQYTNSTAKRDAPNTRRYRYDRTGTGSFEYSRGTDGNEIISETLNDDVQELRLSASLPYSFGEVWSANFQAGLGALARDRDAGARRLKYSIVGSIDPRELQRPLNQIFTASNIGPNGFQLIDTTRALDRYEAEQDIYSLFLSADLNNYETWRFYGGLRFEDNQQIVTSIEPNQGTATLQGGLDKRNILPSVSVTYTLSESDQLRGSYARTVSRPDFRELSPAPFFDPSLDVESRGNPDLEQTTIDHLDARFERYLGESLTVSSGVFYKRFDKPIERVFVPGTGGLLSYENAESADVYGVELEGFLALDQFSDAFAGFSTSGNITLSRSNVELGAAGAIQTNRSRSMQGQSDTLINTTLSYEPEGKSGMSLNLGYSVAGDRISQVGVLGLPDIIEEPFHELSFNASIPFSDSWRAGVKLKNILDESVEFSQGGQPVRRYKPGPEVSFSIQWLN